MEAIPLKCIVCNKESEFLEDDECSSCKQMLDEKYGDDIEGRKFSKDYFRWLNERAEEDLE